MRERETGFLEDLARNKMACINYEFLRELLDKRPFDQFAVHLCSGESHSIRYPNSAALTRTRLVIADPDEERIVVCSLLHITGIQLLQTAS